MHEFEAYLKMEVLGYDSLFMQFWPGDNLLVCWSLGSSTRAVFCLSYTTIVKKVVPFDESCPGTHTGYRIFSSDGDFASWSAGFLGSIFIIILLK
jgi:hypothetical protein